MKKKTLLTAAFMVFVMALLAVPNLDAQYNYLNVPMRYQQHSNWCWAGCSQAIIWYWGRYYPSQCEIANYAKQRYDCCTGGYNNFWWNHWCNYGHPLSGYRGMTDILSYWGISSYHGYGSLNWSYCQWEIDRNRPFVILIFNSIKLKTILYKQFSGM